MATKILRSRRFHDHLIVGAIVAAALAGLGRDLRASAFARGAS